MLSLLLVATLSLPQEPLRVGLLADERAGSGDVAFVRGAKFAADACQRDAASNAVKVELHFAAATTPADVAAAVATLQGQGVVAIVVPPVPTIVDAAKRATAGKVACVAFSSPSPEIPPLLDRLVTQRFCMTRIGFVRDASKDAIELGKTLTKGGLAAPTTLLWELDVTATAKSLQKQFEKERPELLLIDAAPDAVARFLGESLGNDPITVVLTPRSQGDAVRSLARRTFCLNGVSPACVATSSPFRTDYERQHGVPGLGAAEGYEGVMAIALAARSGPARDAAGFTKALEEIVVDGVRGRVPFDKARGAFTTPLAAWIVENGAAAPYLPRVVPVQLYGGTPGAAPAAASGTTTSGAPAALKPPQKQIGEPFGTWRTRQFVLEEGAQWVICEWASEAGFASIDEDLRVLGLSTGGADPLVDHLVKEELMARAIAITSTKFLRREDGTGIEGKSLRISFGMHVSAKERDKKKQRVWAAYFGGDHPDAGGEAFGTFCRVYSKFIRRTIFEKHALSPAVTAADREYLDGSYVFGSEHERDKRSELIRALINGYAGSMALTLAHEVGHLAGLGHVDDDPVEIMNVNEGAGLDYRDAKFGTPSLESMAKRYGIVGDKPGKKK